MQLNLDEIDIKLRKVIKELNDSGLETSSCCQGRTGTGDTHCDHAFISFEKPLRKKMVKKAEALGLCVYNGNTSISSPIWPEDEEMTKIGANGYFVEQVAMLFGLKS